MSKKMWIVAVMVLMVSVIAGGCTDNTNDELTDMEDNITTYGAVDDDEMGPAERVDRGVRMEHYGAMRPSEIEKNTGDTLVWRNLKPQGTYVLISDDGLFEDQEMYVHATHSYTFNKIGTYTFSVKDMPDMTLKVIVQ